MAFHAAGKKLPVNFVLVCEGEEEIGSPHFAQIVQSPEVLTELKKCVGILIPEAGQDLDGGTSVLLGGEGHCGIGADLKRREVGPGSRSMTCIRARRHR